MAAMVSVLPALVPGRCRPPLGYPAIRRFQGSYIVRVSLEETLLLADVPASDHIYSVRVSHIHTHAQPSPRLISSASSRATSTFHHLHGACLYIHDLHSVFFLQHTYHPSTASGDWGFLCHWWRTGFVSRGFGCDLALSASSEFFVSLPQRPRLGGLQSPGTRARDCFCSAFDSAQLRRCRRV